MDNALTIEEAVTALRDGKKVTSDYIDGTATNIQLGSDGCIEYNDNIGSADFICDILLGDNLRIFDEKETK